MLLGGLAQVAVFLSLPLFATILFGLGTLAEDCPNGFELFMYGRVC